ncbi:MAG: GNAT family N-acetyltransferase [Bryobacterales bacterium]|nr:GNAT family N-acetyltransferase [Bryobacterales bacterium]
MLLRGTAQIFGDDLRSFAVYDPSAEVGTIIGVPAMEHIRRMENACTGETVLLTSAQTAEELGQALSSWRCEIAILHTLSDFSRLPSSDDIRLLTPPDIHALEIDSDLKAEFADAAAFSPLSVAYAGSEPASFCYASWQTESLWDVSIDTLPEYQRQGHASRNAAWMIRFQRDAGRMPVWGAVESNIASINCARKLGFVEADRICVFGK